MKGTGASIIPSNLNIFIETGNTVQCRTNADISKALNLYLSKFFPLIHFQRRRFFALPLYITLSQNFFLKIETMLVMALPVRKSKIQPRLAVYV
jgi:hypothetical protein